VDFTDVSTVGLESSPHAEALAGLRANEARYFKNKYDHVFVVEPAKVAKDAVEWVHEILEQERGIGPYSVGVVWTQGLGRFELEDFVPCQTEFGAPEAGAGDPSAKDWNWNSPYWRKLGAPWGGTHCSAGDIGKYLAEFLYEKGAVVKPETARLMLTNHNGPGLTPRGLGFNIGAAAGSPGCSETTFGHTGSTGTLAWADRASETICVVLTSLPGRAVQPHPRELAAAEVAKAMM